MGNTSGGGNQKEGTLSALDVLRQRNKEMEELQQVLGEQKTKVYQLEKLLLKEFKEPYREAILVAFPTMVNGLTLNLRSQRNEVPLAAALNPMKDSKKDP